MKASRRLSHALAATLALALAAGCGNQVTSLEDLTAYTPAGNDADAGTWRMVVLGGPTDVAVPPPAPVESAAYQAELATIRSAQQILTEEQREAVDYWSAGGVLRWNQLMRELVARYNLPPAPRDSGTYPAPDPENPFADPPFPFANPPYAVRAYSYVGARPVRGPEGDPPRPPMLPNFGRGRPWMMTAADITAERPGPPPSTSSAQMGRELDEVKQTAANLTREQLAIAIKWNDGVSTYTPPGHWNDIATEHVRDARWSEVRAARAFALLNMAMHDAGIACWDAKFTYFSRLYGAIHYRADIEVGVTHGTRIGEYTVRFARQDGAD